MQILDEIEEFITGVRPVPAVNRVLATVLFTDMVDSRSTPPSAATGRGGTCSSVIATGAPPA